MRVLAIFIALIGLNICHGDTKIWQRDVNFGNPGNWASGKVPCAADSIRFPENMGVVFMQTNSTLKEIRLPLNGALVLDNNLKLAFTDNANVQVDCEGQDQVFSHDTAESWFDPVNWVGASGPVAVDTENIPCQFDNGVFPLEKLFYLGIDQSVTLGSITFSGKDYTSTSTFSNFLRSPSGQQQFSLTNDATVQLQNRQCGDVTGCVCGNDVEPTRTKICNMRAGSCPALSCADAPTPVGGCCRICGGIVTMEYDAQAFNFNDLKTHIETTFALGSGGTTSNSVRKRRQADSDVTMYMSKTSENKIQIVLTDNISGTNNGQAAINLAADIQSDVQENSEKYGITSVNMQSSKKSTGGLSGDGVSGGGIAGIIIAVIIVICVVSTLVFLLLRRNSFAMKDEPLHADIEMSQGLPPGFIQEIPNPSFDAAVRGFDNPIYGPTKDNLYADPVEVKGEPPVDVKSAYMIEEKGAINGPHYEEDEGIKSFTNPMSGGAFDETLA